MSIVGHRHLVKLFVQTARRPSLESGRFTVLSRSVHLISDEKSSFDKIAPNESQSNVIPSMRQVVDVDISEFNALVTDTEIPENALTGVHIGLASYAPTSKYMFFRSLLKEINRIYLNSRYCIQYVDVVSRIYAVDGIHRGYRFNQ